MNLVEMVNDLSPLDKTPIQVPPPTNTNALTTMMDTTMMISLITQPFHCHLKTLDNFHCNLLAFHWSIKQFTLVLQLMMMMPMMTMMLPIMTLMMTTKTLLTTILLACTSKQMTNLNTPALIIDQSMCIPPHPPDNAPAF